MSAVYQNTPREFAVQVRELTWRTWDKSSEVWEVQDLHRTQGISGLMSNTGLMEHMGLMET